MDGPVAERARDEGGLDARTIRAILKATLPVRPSGLRAVTTVFEAIALWEGRPVRAVLVADESSTSSCPTTLYCDTFAIHGERTALYEFEWLSHVPGPRPVARRARRNG